MPEADEQDGRTDGSKKPTGWLEWVKGHPAVVGTVLYAYVSALGSTYNWLFLRQFDINYFDFAEANDFLTAAFRQPMTFVYLAFAVIPLGIAMKSPAPPLPARLKLWHEKAKANMRTHLSAQIVFWGIIPIFAFVYGAAESSHRDVRRTVNGFGSYVVVDLVRQLDTFESLPDTLMLLGTSDKFIFLWDRAADSSHIVPIANVARLRICKTPCDP